MDKRLKFMKILIAMNIILLLQTRMGFCQRPYQPNMVRSAIGKLSPVITGEVEKIDNDTIIIKTLDGKREGFQITSRTSFVKELNATRDRLKIGDALLVVGPWTDKDIVHARIVKILAASEDLDTGPPISKRSVRGQEEPGRWEAGMIPGPLVGEVISIRPLTIKMGSEQELKVLITPETRLLLETKIEPREILEGLNVRINTTVEPGKERTDAQKVILFSNERDPSREQEPFYREKPRRAMTAIPTREIAAVDFLDSPFGFLTAPPQPAYLFDLDVNWMVTGIRLASWEEVESRRGVFDFSAVDKRIAYLFKNGINTIVELRAINPIYGTRSGKKGIRGVSFPEEHLFEWGRFVEKLVERYDGDGINDAPGSPIIKNYQLIHELVMPRRMKGFWRENPDKYAQFFKITYDAIRRSCDDCNLFFTGGFEEDFMFQGDTTLDRRVVGEDGFFVNVLREFQKQGARLRNIGFDYHYWSPWLFDPKASPETYRHHLIFINHIKKLYQHFGYTADSVSIISKESGVNGYLEREREQAIYLIKAYAVTIAAGQRHLFWTSIVEYQQEAPLFLGMGLIHNPRHHGYSHKKLAYYTYKLMVEKLKDSDWRNVETVVDGKDNIHVYKFTKRKSYKPIFIVWWDSFKENGSLQEKEVFLSLDISSNEVTITSTIPDAKNGLEIQDRVMFKREVKNVGRGSISILLGNEPMYIEEGVIPQPLYHVKSIDPAMLDQLIE